MLEGQVRYLVILCWHSKDLRFSKIAKIEKKLIGSTYTKNPGEDIFVTDQKMVQGPRLCDEGTKVL